MRLVDGLQVDLVDPVEDVEEVALGVDVDLVDGGDDLADDLLACCCPRSVAKAPQVRQQLAVDEGRERAHRAPGQSDAPGARGSGPVAPAIRRLERRRERRADRLGLLGLELLALVEDAQEQDPRQLWARTGGRRRSSHGA